jgi:hypothetical protein
MRTNEKVPLRLELQPEGGYTVTSPAPRHLVTEGTPLPEALRREVTVIEIDYPVIRQRACRRRTGARVSRGRHKPSGLLHAVLAGLGARKATPVLPGLARPCPFRAEGS